MKKYDVYAVGNALVDTEFEVSDIFFDEYDIEKGCMTLVTKEHQQHLMGVLKEKYEHMFDLKGHIVHAHF